MGSNKNSKVVDDNLTKSGLMIAGLKKYGVTLGVKQNDEAAMTAARLALRGAQKTFKATEAALIPLHTAVTNTETNVTTYLGAVRRHLCSVLSPQWTNLWQGTGFGPNSTAVPQLQQDKLGLLDELDQFFTDHPALEVNTSVLTITALRSHLMHESFEQNLNDLSTGESAVEQAETPRDAAHDDLRARMTGLVAELTQLMGPLDPRWREFGLNQPGALGLPDAATNLVLSAGVTGQVQAHWTRGVRSTRTRLFDMIQGVDLEMKQVDYTTEEYYNFDGLTTGQTLRVQIMASNDAGDAPFTPVAEIVVP